MLTNDKIKQIDASIDPTLPLDDAKLEFARLVANAAYEEAATFCANNEMKYGYGVLHCAKAIRDLKG